MILHLSLFQLTKEKKSLGQKSQKYENRMKFVLLNVDFMRFLYFNSV